jgi:hypothetical protein
MESPHPPAEPARWQYSVAWRYGHFLLAIVGLALIAVGVSGITSTVVAVTALPLGMILLIAGAVLPRLKGPFTAGPTGIGADMLPLHEVDRFSAFLRIPAVAPDAPAGKHPVRLGDVWEALDAASIQPISVQPWAGTATVAGPDGQRLRLPGPETMTMGTASTELLSVLDTWGIRPLPSGKYEPVSDYQPTAVTRTEASDGRYTFERQPGERGP